MENRRYRNGSHKVRGNARRPFRHVRRIQKLANSATIHYSLLPVRCPDDTATVYYNYRHYEPVTGRWMARDPIGIRGGSNEFCFIDNFTVSAVDRIGYQSLTTQVYLNPKFARVRELTHPILVKPGEWWIEEAAKEEIEKMISFDQVVNVQITWHGYCAAKKRESTKMADYRRC